MHETVLNDRVQVTLGSLDQPENVRPDDHVWTESQLVWLHIDDDLPRFPRSSSAVPSRALGEYRARSGRQSLMVLESRNSEKLNLIGSEERP